MKASLLKVLDVLVADELTATMQYVVHPEMCESWGDVRLGQVPARAIDELGFRSTLEFRERVNDLAVACPTPGPAGCIPTRSRSCTWIRNGCSRPRAIPADRGGHELLGDDVRAKVNLDPGFSDEDFRS